MGQLLRILIISLSVGLALLLLRHTLTRRRAPRNSSGASVQQMVQCSYCGVHLPEANALHVGARVYCSETHREVDKSR